MGTLTVLLPALGNFLLGVGVVLFGVAAIFYVFSKETRDE